MPWLQQILLGDNSINTRPALHEFNEKGIFSFLPLVLKHEGTNFDGLSSCLNRARKSRVHCDMRWWGMSKTLSGQQKNNLGLADGRKRTSNRRSNIKYNFTKLFYLDVICSQINHDSWGSMDVVILFYTIFREEAPFYWQFYLGQEAPFYCVRRNWVIILLGNFGRRLIGFNF